MLDSSWRRSRWALSLIAILSVPAMVMAGDAAIERRAEGILARLDSPRGICVLVDPSPAALATALAQKSELTVYVQLPDRKAADAARAHLDDLGLLGTRVCVETGPWSRVHLADNLADAVVVSPGAVPAVESHREELLRVVRPLGKLILGDGEATKPYPDGADDWTHPYYRPDNNPQSHDRLARRPYLTQFLSEPWYVPFPEVTVTAAGRVFKAFGHVGYKERDWPWVNTLVAINGYNGTLLWKRPLQPGFNIHRNTMIATADVLYVADSKSCKLIDTATGKLKDEISVPEGSTGPVWKWMALRDGVLYAMVGDEEFRDETLRGNRTDAGWPWRPMTAGYDGKEYPWGFGRTLFAMDLKTRKVLWLDNEEKPIDARAMAMSGHRIFYYSHPNFLACREASEGKVLWRNADKDLLEAIGPHHRAQEPSTGFSSQVYMLASDKGVYFAGPQRTRLVAASTENGKLLWQYPHGNFGLVLREEGLFAMGRTGPSKLFEPLTGKIIADIECLRGNCTRATGTVDSVFARGHEHGGTVRLGAADLKIERMGMMRPDCHDGVIVANGMLYWGPWMCDCSLSLVGIICMGPAGDFAFNAEAVESERLERFEPSAGTPPALAVAAGDWPAYRADNRRSAASRTRVPTEVALAWQHQPPTARDPAAPITAGGLVFASGADGVVRALDAANGTCRWKAYTAGPITFPPAVSENRLLVGSGDGCVWAFAAADGKPLWRFRAAPAQRMIPVYGRLRSTWPVASGVLVDNGAVYAAAGIASYDGTHVYALDAATGAIRWQNNTAGRLANSDHVTGVSVQGHLLLNGDRLYLAGGNVVSPAVFDTKDGHCLNGPVNEWAKAPRGRELFVVDDKVVAFDRLLYAPKEYWKGRYFVRRLIQADSPGTNTLIRGVDDRIVRVVPGAKDEKELAALWTTRRFKSPVALAIGDNAVVIAGTSPEGEQVIAAFATDDGREMWSQTLPGMPIQGGLALDATGRIVVGLENGRYLCFAQK